MAKKKWSTVVNTAIKMYKSKDYVYFYGAKGMITDADGNRVPQIMTEAMMNELIRQSPGHFSKYSQAELEQIKKNSLGRIGIDCSGFTGDCTGDEQWSTGQISNCSKYNTIAGGPTGSLLYTTWRDPAKRHIGLDIGNGYCLQAGYESTDAIVAKGLDGIFLSKISDWAWEKSGESKVVDYTGAVSPYAPTTKLVEEVFEPKKTPLYVVEATTLVNVRTEPIVKNDINGYPLNALPQWPMLGTGNLVDVCDDSFASGWYYVRIAGQYYGWVMSKYFKKPAPRTPEVGDKVRFTGTKIYTSSYSNGKGVAVPNFTAKVTQKNDKAHPYLLKSTGKDGYEGWANTSDVQLI